MIQLLEKHRGNLRGRNVQNKKIIIGIFIGLLLLCFIALTGFAVQTYRLERSMERCEQYRIELELAQNREYEIGEAISRTSIILRQTSDTVEGLREKLKTVENSYNYMWELLHNDNNCVDNKGGE